MTQVSFDRGYNSVAMKFREYQRDFPKLTIAQRASQQIENDRELTQLFIVQIRDEMLGQIVDTTA